MLGTIYHTVIFTNSHSHQIEFIVVPTINNVAISPHYLPAPTIVAVSTAIKILNISFILSLIWKAWVSKNHEKRDIVTSRDLGESEHQQWKLTEFPSCKHIGLYAIVLLLRALYYFLRIKREIYQISIQL